MIEIAPKYAAEVDRSDIAVAPETLQKLLGFVATRDRRIFKLRPWNPTPIGDYLRELIAKGRVVVGGRASCGGKVDQSWLIFAAWNEVVEKARRLGWIIRATNVPQKNAWASKAGGFWDEREYSFEPVAP